MNDEENVTQSFPFSESSVMCLIICVSVCLLNDEKRQSDMILSDYIFVLAVSKH